MKGGGSLGGPRGLGGPRRRGLKPPGGPGNLICGGRNMGPGGNLPCLGAWNPAGPKGFLINAGGTNLGLKLFCLIFCMFCRLLGPAFCPAMANAKNYEEIQETIKASSEPLRPKQNENIKIKAMRERCHCVYYLFTNCQNMNCACAIYQPVVPQVVPTYLHK